MAEEVFTKGGKPTIRSALLVRLLFDVLAEADHPLHRQEVHRRIADRLDPTPRELSANASGTVRWEAFVNYTSSWAKKIGWLTKARGEWALTDAGREAARNHPGEALSAALDDRWAELFPMSSAAAAGVELLSMALNLLAPGQWTTYGDLAQLTGLANQGVSQAMRQLGTDAAHRVLQSDGTISPTFAWYDGRQDDPRHVLEEEGLEFDADGHADHAARITVDDFRDLLDIEPPAARAWLVRGNNVAGRDLVPDWLTHGYCSLPASQARQLSPGMDRAQISGIVDSEYADKSYAARADKITEFDTFLNRMRLDDLVATVSNGRLYIGRITGEPAVHASEGDRSNLRRPVAWSNPNDPVDFADLSPALSARLAVQRAIVDLTSERATLEALRQDTPEPSPVESPARLTGLRAATDDLAHANLVPRDWLQEVIDLLWERKQLIFYGPPGTGKTYLARAIARHVTDTENVKLVQFHPAYSYEDFFEGYRPAAPSDDGRVGFALTPGPFRRLVEAARENPSTPYVLIIDEINRANLAKVFGELYFLLEYRDETIDLLYASGDEAGFSLPDNLFLIGTMNTADRSIALVDAAMRRRFAFVQLHPDTEPTAGLLRAWLDRLGHPSEVADLLEALNARIDDPDFRIGPSYLMRPSVHRDITGLERVWRTAILPLLEEHHFGEDVDIAARYGVPSLRASLAARQTTETLAAEATDAEPSS